MGFAIPPLVLTIALATVLAIPQARGHLCYNLGNVYLSKAVETDSLTHAHAVRAESWFRRALPQSASTKRVLEHLGLALLTQNRMDEAVALMERARVSPQELVERGAHAKGVGNYGMALNWFGCALGLDPRAGDSWYYVGRMYEELHMWSAALDAYEKCVAADYLNWVGISEAYIRLAMIHETAMGDMRDEHVALDLFRQAVAANDFGLGTVYPYVSHPAECYLRYGILLRKLGGTGAADEYLASFELAEFWDPDSYGAVIWRGRSLYDARRDLATAVAEVERGIEQDPTRPQGYAFLGDIYREEGMTLQSKAAYEKALKLQPKNSRVRRILLELASE